jgi:uncharacterized protein (TIGR03085 family)
MPARYARRERHALADTLLAAGPDAPTLCEGWATRDLAAHLVLREQRLIAAPGILIKPLAGVTKRIQAELAAGDYAKLVEQVRNPAWWVLSRIDTVEEAMNLGEFLIHHEDVRRAATSWEPRSLEQGYEEALFRRARGTARLAARRFPASIVATSPGYGEFTAGKGGERVAVQGAPAELMLFFAGRQRATQVDVSGPDELVTRVQKARFGL